MHLTMAAVKLCQALSDTPSSASYYIMFRKNQHKWLIQIAQRKETIANYHFGLSALHASIRCVESILHIAYRLSVCKCYAVSIEHKAIFEITKQIICQGLKDKMDLIINQLRKRWGEREKERLLSCHHCFHGCVHRAPKKSKTHKTWGRR